MGEETHDFDGHGVHQRFSEKVEDVHVLHFFIGETQEEPTDLSLSLGTVFTSKSFVITSFLELVQYLHLLSNEPLCLL